MGGLLLSERFMNLPHEMVVAMHRSILEGIEWSCTTPECPPEERPFYGFTHFIGVVRCFGADPAASSASSSGVAGKKKKKKHSAQTADAGGDGAQLVFQQVEDEFYVKKASFSFSFPMPVKETRE